MEPLKDIAIVGGCRTPFIKAGTVFKDIEADELGRLAASELFYRLEIDPSMVDETVFGNVGNPMDAMNVARVIALRSGVPRSRPAHTVHRNCASGFEAITTAAEKILTGQAETVLAGGTESMSNMPLVFGREYADIAAGIQKAKTTTGKLTTALKLRPRHFKPIPALLRGLTDPFTGMLMGQTAELLANEWDISREGQDEFALQSHMKAIDAQRNERLRDEIVPVYVPPQYSDTMSYDNGVREDSSIDKLAKLRPFFDKRGGTVTPGNSSQVTDGAVAVLVMSAEKCLSLGIEPLGYLRSWAYAGLDPERMGLGPVHATPRALERAGLSMGDMNLVELNEAFAAQVLANLRAFESKEFAQSMLGKSEAVGTIEPEILNVNGGGIALGHPVGATGTRLVLTLLQEMQRRDVQFGLATLCVGGGLGGTLVLERRNS
ncbi:MAG: thiolase family protein [Planctomycetota bacterium]|nr:thiolase family protein [Planctomycetota bacterium]